jgi:putative membrane protein
MVGNMSVDEFNRLNAQGAAAVAAITPTSGQLSSRDRSLMMEVAMGGMMQLEVSRAALEKVTNPEARILAQ